MSTDEGQTHGQAAEGRGGYNYQEIEVRLVYSELEYLRYEISLYNHVLTNIQHGYRGSWSMCC